MNKGKATITIENMIYDPSIEDGRIFTSVGYNAKNQGGGGPCNTKERIKESLDGLKKHLTKEGYTIIIQDLRFKIPKKELNFWMQPEQIHKMKVVVKWSWDQEHRKIHHRIEWLNHQEFGDMIGKKGHMSCCKWDENEDPEKHGKITAEESIKKLIKENELNCEFEIEEEYEEWFSASKERWKRIAKLDGIYRELVKKHGFEKHKGFSVHKIKELNAHYKKTKDPKEFLKLVQKCTNIEYKIYVRESTLNGDFIEEGYKPGQHDESAENIIKIKKWLKSKDKINL